MAAGATLDEIRAGIEGRNISEAWSSVTGRPLAVAHTEFTDVQLRTLPVVRERTADEIQALFRTTSLWFQLGERAQRLAEQTRPMIEGFGGTVRTTELGALVTARRR